MSSPNAIFPPRSSHCVLIPAKKNSARIKRWYIFIFLIALNLELLKAVNAYTLIEIF